MVIYLFYGRRLSWKIAHYDYRPMVGDRFIWDIDWPMEFPPLMDHCTPGLRSGVWRLSDGSFTRVIWPDRFGAL